MLFKARKLTVPKPSEEEQHVLTIIKEHVTDADITIPALYNCLDALDRKGYLVAFVLHEQELRNDMQKLYGSTQFEKTVAELKKLEGNTLSVEQKQKIADALKKRLPPGMDFPEQDFLNEELSISNLLEETRDVIEYQKEDMVATIVLLPFRSIEWLLEQMNTGLPFDDIKDPGVWYDPSKYEFHIAGETISTSYQGKLNIEHDVLMQLHNFLDDGVIYYDEIDTHKPKAIKDAFTRFIKKHPELPNIFTVHLDRLEFDKTSF